MLYTQFGGVKIQKIVVVCRKELQYIYSFHCLQWTPPFPHRVEMTYLHMRCAQETMQHVWCHWYQPHSGHYSHIRFVLLLTPTQYFLLLVLHIKRVLGCKPPTPQQCYQLYCSLLCVGNYLFRLQHEIRSQLLMTWKKPDIDSLQSHRMNIYLML